MSLPLFSLTRASPLPSLPQRAPPPPKKKATPQQKKTAPVGDVPLHLRRYRPHLPEALVTETTAFLKSSSKLRCLLDLIFSPKESKDTESDRNQMQQRLEEYHLMRQRHDAPFLLREAAAAASAWRALGALPSDLYAEAIQSSNASAVATAAAEAAPAPPATEANGAQQWQQKIAQKGLRKETLVLTPQTTEELPERKDSSEEEWEEYKQQQFPEELAFHQMYRQQIFSSLTETEKHKLQVFQNLIHIRFPHSELKKRQPELFWISERQAVGRQKEQALKAKKK